MLHRLGKVFDEGLDTGHSLNLVIVQVQCCLQLKERQDCDGLACVCTKGVEAFYLTTSVPHVGRFPSATIGALGAGAKYLALCQYAQPRHGCEGQPLHEQVSDSGKASEEKQIHIYIYIYIYMGTPPKDPPAPCLRMPPFP